MQGILLLAPASLAQDDKCFPCVLCFFAPLRETFSFRCVPAWGGTGCCAAVSGNSIIRLYFSLLRRSRRMTSVSETNQRPKNQPSANRSVPSINGTKLSQYHIVIILMRLIFASLVHQNVVSATIMKRKYFNQTKLTLSQTISIVIWD